MHLRRRGLAAKVALSLRRPSRLFRHSDPACDAEAGNNLQEKDAAFHSETIGSKPSISQKASASTPPSPTSLSDSSTNCASLASPEILPHPESHHPSRQHHSGLRGFLAELLKPAPIVIVFAIVIALVDPLKALFLPPSANFQPRFRPVAPDGQPPLAFILDTAAFVGAASVPIGLVCLGSALACLRVRLGEAFPVGAIAALALAKMVVTPLLGVGLTRLFAHAGFVRRDDKVLQFVCMCMCRPPCGYARALHRLLTYGSVFSLFSGLPTATTQVSWLFCSLRSA